MISTQDSAIVASCDRSPISAATVSAKASPASSRALPRVRSMTSDSDSTSSASASSSAMTSPASSIASASTMDLAPKYTKDAMAT